MKSVSVCWMNGRRKPSYIPCQQHFITLRHKFPSMMFACCSPPSQHEDFRVPCRQDIMISTLPFLMQSSQAPRAWRSSFQCNSWHLQRLDHKSWCYSSLRRSWCNIPSHGCADRGQSESTRGDLHASKDYISNIQSTMLQWLRID